MDAVQAFARLVDRPDEEIDLARATAMIALHDCEVDLDAVDAKLDGMAAGVAGFSELRWRLFEELGFDGDRDPTERIDSIHLHVALGRRRASPILLSLIAWDVGRRAGIPLQFVAMPGHFLVRDPASGLYLDGYNGGAVLDVQGCEAVFREATQTSEEIPFGPRLLPVVGRANTLARILISAMVVRRVVGDSAALGWLLRLRLAVPGLDDDDLIALAETVAEQSSGGRAADELQSWADLSPDLAPRLRSLSRRLASPLN